MSHSADLPPAAPEPQHGVAGEPRLREESMGQLMKELSSDTSRLIRQEIQLAQAEMRQKAKVAGTGAGMLAGAAVASLMTLGVLSAAVIILIALVTPLWVAAVIVTAVWAIVTAVLAFVGRKRLQETSLKPEQTVETAKEDLSWAKTQAQSVKK